MTRRLSMCIFTACVLLSTAAHAQTGDANLRGYVKDEQGGVLPGVTVTARGPQLLAPIVAVTDAAGYYRLNGLPPGPVVMTAELGGFAVTRREGILMRAGLTFTVDLDMKLSSLSETITVAGETPMIETSKPTNTMNIDGELIRAAPITSRRLFSDALDMAPGVSSRNVDDGVGRRAYYFNGAVIFSHVFMLEGAPASSFLDASAHSMALGGDTIQDSELKLGGVDASAPSGTGVVMNITAPRGGNAFKGSAVYDYQPVEWNSDNTLGGKSPGGIPTAQSVKQYDLSLGGPIARDKVWFFASYRSADLTNGISRSPFNVQNFKSLLPGFVPFDNYLKSSQPFIKLTTQINPSHEVSGFYQNDRSRYTSNRELDNKRFVFNGTGGGLGQVKINSVWTNTLTTLFSAAYNNKSGNDVGTYAGANLSGPQIVLHQDAFLTRGIQQGTGALIQMNTPQSIAISPASMIVLRGDLTFYKTGWKGSHEFRTGVWAAPRMTRDTSTAYVNDGFVLQEERQNDPANPAAGTTPFHLTYRSPVTVPSISETDRDIALYLQDAWQPHPRLTASVGLRMDFIKRHDNLLAIDRQNSTAVQPRVGVSYLVTEDARNVLRASYGR
ncbi:MAG: TonB-dependent receptor, partial [Vicinamibacterales bacterium]